VFADAVRALAELLRPARGPVEVRTVVASAGDRAALLAEWLEELVFLAESEGFVATGLIDLQIASGRIDGRVEGVLDDPPPLVKAVTLHRLMFERRGAGYVARVVLDV
jgi:SHS2 domain-containing protein